MEWGKEAGPEITAVSGEDTSPVNLHNQVA